MSAKLVVKWFGHETGWFWGNQEAKYELACIKATILTIGIEFRWAV